MCEPTHSILQCPDEPPDEPGTGGSPAALPAPKPKPKGWLDIFRQMGTKIGGWFHCSKLGGGHSDTLTALGNKAVADYQFVRDLDGGDWNYKLPSIYSVPGIIKYEAEWGSRQVRLDDFVRKDDAEMQILLAHATNYANLVSIGNLRILRRFLENSMRKSRKPSEYVARAFETLIRPERRDYVQHRLNAALNNMTTNILDLRSRSRDDSHRQIYLDRVIRLLLGVTRQRELLVDSWAQDNKLWLPGQLKVEGLPSS